MSHKQVLNPHLKHGHGWVGSLGAIGVKGGQVGAVRWHVTIDEGGDLQIGIAMHTYVNTTQQSIRAIYLIIAHSGLALSAHFPLSL